MAGNHNSGPKKEKPFRTALMLELKRAGEDMPALRRVASKLVAMAEEGDIQAIKELNDRLDGKVPQAVIGGEEDDPAIRTISKVIYEIVGTTPSGS